MLKRMLLCAAAFGLLAGLGATANAALVTFQLGAPTIVGDTASLEVSLTFELGPSETTGTLDTIGLSVVGSDPALTEPTFIRFSFAPSPAISGWSAGGNIGTDGFVSFFDTTFTGLDAGTHVLGTLFVDLSGISATSVVVTIDSGPVGDDTFAAGEIDGDYVEFVPPGFAPGEQTIDVAPVPEPGTLAIMALGGAVSLLGLRTPRRRPTR